MIRETSRAAARYGFSRSIWLSSSGCLPSWQKVDPGENAAPSAVVTAPRTSIHLKVEVQFTVSTHFFFRLLLAGFVGVFDRATKCVTFAWIISRSTERSTSASFLI